MANLIKKYCLKIYESFVKINDEPQKIALGFALGLYMGLAPLIGLQTLLVLFLATLLRWNKLASVLGVWITNPATAPFIYWTTYLTGARIMGLKKTQYIDPDQGITILSQIITKAPDVFWALIIGGIILGIPVALTGYYFAYYAVSKYQTDIKKKLLETKEKIALKRHESEAD